MKRLSRGLWKATESMKATEHLQSMLAYLISLSSKNHVCPPILPVTETLLMFNAILISGGCVTQR